MTGAALLIVEAMRAGVFLQADGDRLRFKAVSSLPPDLARRLIASKREVLDELQASGPTVTAPTPPSTPSAPVSAPRYSQAEQIQLDKLRPGVRSSVDAIKEAFTDFGGVTIVAVHRDPDCPRNQTAQALRLVRQTDRTQARALRDAWRERIAICEVDGNLTADEAQRIAAAEVKAMLVKWQVPR